MYEGVHINNQPDLAPFFIKIKVASTDDLDLDHEQRKDDAGPAAVRCRTASGRVVSPTTECMYAQVSVLGMKWHSWKSWYEKKSML